jgi:hypothetical protein
LHLLPQAEVWHLGLYRERTLKPVSAIQKLPVAPTVELCLCWTRCRYRWFCYRAVQVLKEVSRIKFVAWLLPRRREALHAIS